ncbi:MAG TPA: hypothetical protein VN704_04555 [Verrucomicrobiae bacterium]|nr:hypothetical protein [Verrucomicrobiae bacterium]
MSKPNSVNTAIRIPADVYEKIESQSISEDKTISSIINQILKKYVTWDQFVNDIGFFFIQKPFLNFTFEHIRDEDIIYGAKTICYTGLRDAITFIHGKVDAESILDVIKLWLSASNLSFKIISNKNTIEIRIHHDIGKKASIYIGSVIEKLLSDIGTKTEQLVLEDHSIFILLRL